MEMQFLIVMFPTLTFAMIAIRTVLANPLPSEDMLLYWRRSGDAACEPFTTYMMDCNKCVCAADGVSYCTKMLCMQSDKRAEGKDYSNEIDKDDNL